MFSLLVSSFVHLFLYSFFYLVFFILYFFIESNNVFSQRERWTHTHTNTHTQTWTDARAILPENEIKRNWIHETNGQLWRNQHEMHVTLMLGLEQPNALNLFYFAPAPQHRTITYWTAHLSGTLYDRIDGRALIASFPYIRFAHTYGNFCVWLNCAPQSVPFSLELFI